MKTLKNIQCDVNLSVKIKKPIGFAWLVTWRRLNNVQIK